MNGPVVTPLDRVHVQAKVEEIWRTVLEIPTINLDDNFFGLGGDSLNAVEMAAGVEMLLGVVIDPFEVLEYPVLKDFVDFLVRYAAEPDQLPAGAVSDHQASS